MSFIRCGLRWSGHVTKDAGMNRIVRREHLGQA